MGNQALLNTLSEVGGQDDEMWSWLIEEVSNILGGEKLEAELKLTESGPFESFMKVHMEGDRVFVDMQSFGYGIVYSWKVQTDIDGEFSFDDFRLEGGDLHVAESTQRSSAHV